MRTYKPTASSTGIQWWYWPRNSSNMFSYDTMVGRLAFGNITDQPFRNTSQMIGGFETPNNYFVRTLNTTDERYGARLVTFFHAPVSGEYRFMVSVDDAAVLYGTKMTKKEDGTASLNRTLLCSARSYTGYRNFFVHPTQISRPVYLEEGEDFLLEAAYLEYGGGDYITVGVQIPSDVPLPDSTSEIQRIVIEYDDYGEQYVFRTRWSATGDAPAGTLRLSVRLVDTSLCTIHSYPPWSSDLSSSPFSRLL